MTAHSVQSVIIDRPSPAVFDLVHDYGQRLRWDSMLRQAFMVDDEAPGKGAVAVCAAHWRLGGLVFATRYVTFARPRLAAVTLVRPYLIFSMWSASIRHRDLPHSPDGAQRSELIYTQTLRCRPGWLSRPLEVVAIRMFRRETARRLTALKAFLETSDATIRG